MANRHTMAQREFVVRKLAAFEPPRSIVADFCAQFPDTGCDENDVKRLDPDSGAVVGPELHMLFRQTREAVMVDPSSAPYAEQKARLIALSADVRFYRGNNQLPESRAVLRQIAEELGAVGAGKAGKAPAGKDDTLTPAFKKIEVTRTLVDPTPVPSESVPQ